MMKFLCAFNVGITFTYGVVHPETQSYLPPTVVRVFAIWVMAIWLGLYFAEVGAENRERND